MRSTADTTTSLVTEFFAAPFRLRTYRRLAYLLLAFPLGLAYFVGLTVGGSLGVGLAVTWVGIPILLGTLLAATAVAGLEATLASRLLGYDVAVPEAFRTRLRREDEGFLDALRRFLAQPTTWTSVGLAFARFAFGLVAFCVTVAVAALLFAAFAAPFVYDDPATTMQLGGNAIDTLPEAVAVAGFGVVGVFVAANLIDLLAGVGGRLTQAFLAVER